jgi:negative regulator of replication initiation
LLLETLERGHGHKEEVNLKRLSVEHVLPQTIDGDDDDGKSWQKMLGPNWPTLHEKWLHALGNLTLTGYNPELGNGSFADKRAAFAESKVSLNQHFLELAQWSDQDIKQRGLELARIVARIWPRPTGGPGYITPAPAPPEQGELVEVEAGEQHRGRSRLLIRVHWSRLGKAGSDEDICEKKATTTMAVFLGKLIRVFGEPMAERLTHLRFVRGKYSLSTNPAMDFLNPRRGKPFGHKLIPETGFYVFTNTETEEKRDDLNGLIRLLEFPPDGVEVSLVD